MDVAEPKPWQHQSPWKGDENTNLGNVGPIAHIMTTNHTRNLYPPIGLVNHLFIIICQFSPDLQFSPGLHASQHCRLAEPARSPEEWYKTTIKRLVFRQQLPPAPVPDQPYWGYIHRYSPRSHSRGRKRSVYSQARG